MGKSKKFINESNKLLIKNIIKVATSLLTNATELYFPMHLLVDIRKSCLWYSDIGTLRYDAHFNKKFMQSIRAFNKIFKLKLDIKLLRKTLKAVQFTAKKAFIESKSDVKDFWQLILPISSNKLKKILNAFECIQITIRQVEGCHKVTNVWRKKYSFEWCNILVYIYFNSKMFNLMKIVNKSVNIYHLIKKNKEYLNIFK